MATSNDEQKRQPRSSTAAQDSALCDNVSPQVEYLYSAISTSVSQDSGSSGKLENQSTSRLETAARRHLLRNLSGQYLLLGRSFCRSVVRPVRRRRLLASLSVDLSGTQRRRPHQFSAYRLHGANRLQHRCTQHRPRVLRGVAQRQTARTFWQLP